MCKECALVEMIIWLVCVLHVNRVIDVGSEWRTFSNETSGVNRSRVGAAEVLEPSSVNTHAANFVLSVACDCVKLFCVCMD